MGAAGSCELGYEFLVSVDQKVADDQFGVEHRRLANDMCAKFRAMGQALNAFSMTATTVSTTRPVSDPSTR